MGKSEQSCELFCHRLYSINLTLMRLHIIKETAEYFSHTISHLEDAASADICKHLRATQKNP